MARITPSTGSPLENPLDINNVRNMVPYRARLIRTDWATGSAEYGSQQRLVCDWELIDVPSGPQNQPGQVRDYYGLALGARRDGTVAQLRQMLNAIADTDEQAEVSFFDDETMEWGYEGEDGPAWGQLQKGWEVTVMGKITAKQNGTGSFFNIVQYLPASAEPPAAPAPAPRAPARTPARQSAPAAPAQARPNGPARQQAPARPSAPAPRRPAPAPAATAVAEEEAVEDEEIPF